MTEEFIEMHKELASLMWQSILDEMDAEDNKQSELTLRESIKKEWNW